MRIPKRLNAMLDRLAGRTPIISIVLVLVVAAVTAPWLPALAAFVAGTGVGGVAVHVRMSARVARLRAEADDLLRETGALRHENAVIARVGAATGSEVTHKLPTIPQPDDGAAGSRPGRPAGPEPAAADAAPADERGAAPAGPPAPAAEPGSTATRTLPGLSEEDVEAAAGPPAPAAEPGPEATHKLPIIPEDYGE